MSTLLRISWVYFISVSVVHSLPTSVLPINVQQQHDEAVHFEQRPTATEAVEVRNLTVTVALSGDSRDAAHDPIANKRLKIVVRWLHPTNGKPPEGYNIQVQAIGGPAASDGCVEHFADYFRHVDYGEPTVAEIGDSRHSHLVQFGCTYAISIQASPVVSPGRATHVNLTVPDCVSGVCRCGPVTRLPKAQGLTAIAMRPASNDDGVSYLITWTYPDENAAAAALVVRVERAERVMGASSIYRKVREFRHKVEPPPPSHRYQQPIHLLEAHSSYRVRVAAEDVHHCEGHVAELYLNKELHLDGRHGSHKETMVSAVVLGVVFLAAVGLVVALSWRRFLRRLHLMAAAAAASTAGHQSRYRSPQIFHSDSRRSNPLANGSGGACQNFINVLHIDKESEEPRNHLLGKGIDDYEIDPSQLKLGVEIGKGAFGRVHLATVENLPGQPGPTLVAVKQMKKKVGVDERDDFLAEIAMMKRVGRHENIVVMLACITQCQPYSMVLEYVPNGDLLHYLRTLRAVYQQSKSWDKGQSNADVTTSVAGSGSSVALLPKRSSASHTTSDGSKSYHLNNIFSSSSHSTDSSHSSSSYVIPNYYRGLLKKFPTCRTINTEELHDFARQIARGMEHLEMKGITHRDLAARNLLVSEGRVLKISDFGLSRHGVYVNTRTRMLPLRWLALESMTDNLYSSQSDVWAFGVVLWEICTLGGFPYASVSDAQLMTYLKSGNRLPKPDNVTEKLYALMSRCWSASPDDRPTFQQLRAALEDFEAQHETYVDFSADVAPALPPTEELVDNNR